MVPLPPSNTFPLLPFSRILTFRQHLPDLPDLPRDLPRFEDEDGDLNAMEINDEEPNDNEIGENDMDKSSMNHEATNDNVVDDDHKK